MTTFTGVLHPFQRNGVDPLVRTRPAMLADDVGVGNTVQMAAAIAELWELDSYRRQGASVEYITAASLITQTTDEHALVQSQRPHSGCRASTGGSFRMVMAVQGPRGPPGLTQARHTENTAQTHERQT